MNYNFMTTDKEIDLTIMDDSCETKNVKATIFWRLDIDSDGNGITGMTPRIEKIDAKWDVVDGTGPGERHEIIEYFKGRETEARKPNAWDLIETIVQQFGSFFIDQIAIDMNAHRVSVVYNTENE